MRVIEFEIPYPRNRAAYCKRYGLNAYFAGMHWAQRKKNADDMHSVVTYALLGQGIRKKPFENPVKITFWHNTNMDIDNHAVVEKLIVDALKGYLLVNDGKKWYRERTSRYHDADCVKVRIEELTK